MFFNPTTLNESTTDSPVPDLDIRRYTPADFTDLVAMYSAYSPAEQTLGSPPLSSDRLTSWLESLLAEGEHWLAVTDDIIGHLSLLPITEDRAELAIYIHPEYLNRGIGTALCECALTEGLERYETIWLVVERSNLPAMILFENVGFEVIDRTRGEHEMECRQDGGASVAEV